MPKEYFLGANTGGGFVSLYGALAEECGFVRILKGGPGCGKSGFLRRVAAAAENAGHTVERIRCAGDPDSLDGVCITDRGVAYIDGTPPHTLEASCPGVQANYVNLGVFYDEAGLAAVGEEIECLTRAYREKMAEAQGLLAEAAALHSLLEALYNPFVDFDGVYALAQTYIEKDL